MEFYTEEAEVLPMEIVKGLSRLIFSSEAVYGI